METDLPDYAGCQIRQDEGTQDISTLSLAGSELNTDCFSFTTLASLSLVFPVVDRWPRYPGVKSQKPSQ